MTHSAVDWHKTTSRVTHASRPSDSQVPSLADAVKVSLAAAESRCVCECVCER